MSTLGDRVRYYIAYYASNNTEVSLAAVEICQGSLSLASGVLFIFAITIRLTHCQAP